MYQPIQENKVYKSDKDKYIKCSFWTEEVYKFFIRFILLVA